MAEPLYIEMPVSKKKRFPLLWRLLPVWVLLAVAAGFGWRWLDSGRISSAWGILDGTVYAVSPEYSARLEAVRVREGDAVRRGQVVAVVDAGGYAERLREAGGEAAGLRNMSAPVGAVAGPPGMEETAARLKAAQEAEQDMVRRLAQARHEEDASRVLREERVAEHVRAQLELRSLDSQGGARAAGETAYARARRAEGQARLAMESARDAFEEASRMRAALDQELGRIRDALLRHKQMASRGRYVPARPAAPLAAGQADGNLYAPVDGRVLRAASANRQTVQRGEPVVLLLPDGQDSREHYWILAYFPLDAREKIKVGQAVEARLDGSGPALTGKITEVLVPRPLPESSPRGDAEGGALFLPVRAEIDSPGEALPAPGAPVVCVVRTRSLGDMF